MITGDNPLTAVHVARDVEIVDRDVLILDIREGSTHGRSISSTLLDHLTESLLLKN